MATNKGKGGPLKTKKKSEIMSKLKTFVYKGSLDSNSKLNYEDLAKKYKTTRQTISNYMNELYESIPKENLNKFYIDLRIVFDKLETYVNSALKEAETTADKMKVIETYFKLVRERIDVMERFGIKQKIADKVQITQLNVNIDVENEAKAILEDIS